MSIDTSHDVVQVGQLWQRGRAAGVLTSPGQSVQGEAPARVREVRRGAQDRLHDFKRCNLALCRPGEPSRRQLAGLLREQRRDRRQPRRLWLLQLAHSWVRESVMQMSAMAALRASLHALEARMCPIQCWSPCPLHAPFAEAVRQPSAAADAARDWTTRYTADRRTATAELLNFLLQVATCCTWPRAQIVLPRKTNALVNCLLPGHRFPSPHTATPHDRHVACSAST